MTLEAADTLGRTLKLELDSGRAQSRREAEEIVRGYVLQVDVGPGLTASRSRQIALLTVVNAARRAFPGGVHVRIADDPTMSIPWAGGRRLLTAAHHDRARRCAIARHERACLGPHLQRLERRGGAAAQ